LRYAANSVQLVPVVLLEQAIQIVVREPDAFGRGRWTSLTLCNAIGLVTIIAKPDLVGLPNARFPSSGWNLQKIIVPPLWFLRFA
jgi:hypothetical protein